MVVPDIAWLFQVICISRDYAIAIGYLAHTDNIQINKRINCLRWEKRKPLNNGYHKGIKVTAKGYKQPNHEGSEQEKKDKDNGRLPGSLVHLLDDCFITIHESLNHLHIPGIGTMEDVG